METRLSSPPGRRFEEYLPPVCRHIQQYTSRRLTYPSDSLKAMLGIFNHLASSQNPGYHYWGIPILIEKTASSATQGFVAGLCWTGSAKERVRRPAFPSWSWCGWDHAPDGVRYYHNNLSSYRQYVQDLKIAQTSGTYTWESIWSFISAQEATQISVMKLNHDVVGSPQLCMIGRVVHFHTSVHRDEFLDLAFASRQSSAKANLGSVTVWMDVAPTEVTAYTAVLLRSSQHQHGRSISYWFLLLRKVTMPLDGGESEHSEATKIVPGITQYATFDRVGSFRVRIDQRTKQFEELDWHTQSQWEEIIIC